MNTPRKTNAFYRARRELLLDHPFFGSAVMYLNEATDPTCQNLWVDGKSVGYNEQALEALPVHAAAGALASGLLKCLFEHHLRRGSREAKTWNDACDYVVNPVVLESGLKLPDKALINPQYRGKAAEEVYDLLMQQKQQQQSNEGQQQQPAPGGQSGQQPGQQPSHPQQGQGQPQPGQGKPSNKSGDRPNGEVRDMPGDQPRQQQASPAEKGANAREWQLNMQEAVQAAKQQGTLPASLEREITKLLETKVDWKDQLRRFFSSVARDDYSWMRGNRRYLGRRIYLPSAHSERMGEMVVAVDTSGSIGRRALEAFAGEINAIVEDCRPERVHVVYCDARVGRTEEYTVDDLPIKLTPTGGGGTDFRPVFQWIEEQGIAPACVVYLTDLCGSFPPEQDYPVLWASTDGGTAPMGETIRIKGAY